MCKRVPFQQPNRITPRFKFMLNHSSNYYGILDGWLVQACGA
jgi:hypothetical protein